jgi:SSS family solute:Na+ symporter
VLVVAVLAFAFWAYAKTTLVGLLLIGYNGIAQLVPGVVLGVTSRRPSALPVGAGIIAGLLTLIVFAFYGTSQVVGINTGLIALAINIAVTALLWAVVPRPAPSAAQIVSP